MLLLYVIKKKTGYNKKKKKNCYVISFNVTRLGCGARIDISAQKLVLDIDGFLTPQIEKQSYQFWCKNDGKMAHYTYN